VSVGIFLSYINNIKLIIEFNGDKIFKLDGFLIKVLLWIIIYIKSKKNKNKWLPFLSFQRNRTSNKISNLSVEMKAVTWQKDSHGLFDYETKSLSVKKHRVEGSCKVCREGLKFFI
jgi:hypothetical protein